ncbi:MAG: fatty acid desaturase [Myxococcales bacterium]|nr:fatty acid desaturase [Myxococcales bacterium]
MAFLNRVLEPPTYGWDRKPTRRELFAELLRRVNIFKTRKNWAALTGWTTTLLLAIPFLVFFIKYFNPWLLLAGFVYGMVGLGSYGTIWFHRYCTHKAYTFRHPIFRFITRNLVVKIIPEETYVVSHYVHHSISDEPGDPYNAQFGALYCFLADTNHQPINKSLSRADYERVVKMLENTGHKANTYEQYLKWGSVIHPLRCWTHIVLNWAFWYTAFYLIGGHALACALFGGAYTWALGIRTFNYAGHAGGDLRHKDGVDFDRRNLSINQYWPGIVAGEWHNNHHLFPSGARAGFLPHQIDFAWYYIKLLSLIGGVSHFNDFKKQFLDKHYEPFRRGEPATPYSGPPVAKAPEREAQARGLVDQREAAKSAARTAKRRAA